jgi:hypothetical protein
MVAGISARRRIPVSKITLSEHGGQGLLQHIDTRIAALGLSVLRCRNRTGEHVGVVQYLAPALRIRLGYHLQQLWPARHAVTRRRREVGAP